MCVIIINININNNTHHHQGTLLERTRQGSVTLQ